MHLLDLNSITSISYSNILYATVNPNFCLSVTLSPSPFLDTRKPNCFHTSDLKLSGTSAIFQTLSLGSASQFPPTTLALLCLSEQSAKNDGLAWTDGRCSFLFLLRVIEMHQFPFFKVAF